MKCHIPVDAIIRFRNVCIVVSFEDSAVIPAISRQHRGKKCNVLEIC